MNLQEKNMIYGTHLDRVSMSIETGEETAGVSLIEKCGHPNGYVISVSIRIQITGLNLMTSFL